MAEKILIRYFGYGQNRSKRMMTSIIGRKPKGTPAVLIDYKLCIQNWHTIPRAARDGLSKRWGKNFRSYVAIKSVGARIKGTLWFITKGELRSVNRWEKTDCWYTVKRNLRLADSSRRCTTQVITSGFYSEEVNGMNYKTFINDKARLFRTAREVLLHG